jgi:starch phosphorylase
LPEVVHRLPDSDLWALRGDERRSLVAYARVRLRAQLARRGAAVPAALGDVLDANALTIGFARRFAEYKRPNLLLTDPERLVRLLSNAARPVQLVIAGKAHPEDEPGKQLIAEWIEFVNRPDVRGHVVFLEDYDIAVAEKMVAGVDVWLNTPRRPLEACGTSGMKVLVNGGLNLSVLDGWWAEAFSASSGWALDAPPTSDSEDALQLYALLENAVIPEFYDRDAAGIPRAWVQKIRVSMASLTPRFSSNRMLQQYIDEYYAPAASAFHERTRGGAALARELSRWSATLALHWCQIHFGDVHVEASENGLRFRATVYLGEIEPRSIKVEIYADPDAQHRRTVTGMQLVESLTGTTGGHVYEAVVATSRKTADFTVRVIPAHADVLIPLELPLIAWQR